MLNVYSFLSLKNVSNFEIDLLARVYAPIFGGKYAPISSLLLFSKNNALFRLTKWNVF